jgi:hypothetical protein
MADKEQTLGEKRVRVSFNPNANNDVEEIKAQVAAMIDWVEKHKAKDPRLAALAQTAFEEAAMWAVKLVTS